MSGVESALVAAGRAVVWLGDRRARRERSSDLVELLAPALPDLLARRRLGRQFEEIADEVFSLAESLIMRTGAPFVPIKHEDVIYVRPPIA